MERTAEKPEAIPMLRLSKEAPSTIPNSVLFTREYSMPGIIPST